MLKIWCISDTHMQHNTLNVPRGIDMVICAGDASNIQSTAFNAKQMEEFLEWYEKLDIEHKIYVPGNHDTSIEHLSIEKTSYPNITFLIDEEVTIEGIKLYGSPQSLSFGRGWAYNKSSEQIKHYWDAIPKDATIVITHGPPHGILDVTGGGSVGDIYLKEVVEKIRPRYHIFGHIHNEHNTCNSAVYTNNGTTYINASVVDLFHRAQNNGKIIAI